MNNFEEKLIELSSVESNSPDVESFIKNIRLRHEDIKMKTNRTISGLSAFVFILIIGIFTSSQLVDDDYMNAQWTSTDSYLGYDYLSRFDESESFDSSELDQLTLYIIENSYDLDTEEIFYFSILYDETSYKEKSL